MANGSAPLEVWFDGSCGLCRASVAWLRRRDAAGRLTFRDSTSPEAAGHAPVSAPQLATAIWVRRGDGTLAGGFEAIRALLGVLPRWRGLAALLGLPPFRWLGPPVYRLVARHRHRLPFRAPGPRCGADGPDAAC